MWLQNKPSQIKLLKAKTTPYLKLVIKGHCSGYMQSHLE